MQLTVKNAVGIVVLSGIAGAAGALMANRATTDLDPRVDVRASPSPRAAIEAPPAWESSPAVGGSAWPTQPQTPPSVAKSQAPRTPVTPATTPLSPEQPAPALPPASTLPSSDPAASVTRRDESISTPGSVAESAPTFEELVVQPDTVVGLEIETTVSSESGRLEDPVTARVVRDVRVGDRLAIPAGTRVHGEVVLLERGGRLRERARIGVRFTAFTPPTGERTAISTDVILREGEAPSRSSATKIGGGATLGAIVGGILGGAKGAVIGGSAGAGAGTAAVLTGERRPAVLMAGSSVTARLVEPVTVLVDR